MSSSVTVDRGPGRVAGGLAVLAGAAAVGLVAHAPTQVVAIAGTLAGLGAVALGTAVARRGPPVVGWALVVAGGVLVVGALGYAAVVPRRLTHAVELLPGLAGVVLLGLGLLPVRAGWSRRLVAAGAGSVGLAVLASGVLRGAGQGPLLGAMALSVVAWDAGEQAISLGEQVGRRGAGVSAGLAHAAASLGVGGTAVALASGLYGLSVAGGSVVGLVLLLGAALAVSVAAFA